MVLEKLSSSLRETMAKIKNAIFVDEKLINEIVKDIQKALIRSDVNISLVFKISNDIKQRAIKEKPPSGVSNKDYMVKIVYEELVKFLGGNEEIINVSKRPTKIMLVGLFGSGKTTHAGKLGNYFKKKGKRVALVQTDTWRPAAYHQLKQLSDQIGVSFFGDPKEKDPVKIYSSFKTELNDFDVVIIDTAGRDALSDELISELEKIYKAVVPDETLLVISADIGQTAEKQAKTFHETSHVTGIIISKMDGTAKGGGALVACFATGSKVKFIGTGEKIDDLERFDPEGFIGRILGLGDLGALLEKINESIDEEEAKRVSKNLLEGDFTLLDLYSQMEMVKKMGPMKKVMELMPGFSSAQLPKEMLDVQEEKLKKWKFMMDSMTKKELEDPEIIDYSRAKRISDGSGATHKDVRELVKQYKQSKKLVKEMKGYGNNPKAMDKLLKKMGETKGMKNFKGFM